VSLSTKGSKVTRSYYKVHLKRKFAIFLILSAGILWSSGGFMIKVIPWSPFSIAGLRSGIALLTLILLNRTIKIQLNENTILGGFCYALMVIFFVGANKITSAGNVILIQYTAPLYVAILSYVLLDEKPDPYDWITIFTLFFGLSFFFFDDLSFNQLWGNIFAILSSLGFAGTVISLRKQKENKPINSIIVGNLFTFLICTPFYFDNLTIELEAIYGILFLGIFQLGLAYYIYSHAIKYVTAVDASLYAAIEPVASPILAYLFLGEIMGRNSIIGGSIILFSIIIRAFFKEVFKKKVESQ